MDEFTGVLVLAAVITVGVAVAWGYLRGGGGKLKGPPKPCPLKGPVALNPREKIPFKLTKKEEVSRDVRRFRFALQSQHHVLGISPGNHIYVYAEIGGEKVTRSYSPITSNDEQGYFEVMIKVYFANVHPKFPKGGKMSQWLNSLEVGDSVDIRGPAGLNVYLGHGYLRVKEPGKPEQIRCAKEIGLIAGGSGITPILAVIRAVLKDPEDRTKLSLIFANKTEEDILLREELEELAEKNSNFDLWYTVSQAGEEWRYSVGYIDADMISEHLPPPGPGAQILMCGPPPMIKFACLLNLQKLGYSKDMWAAF